MTKHCGIGGAVHEISKQYCGVDGAVREITNEYAGVDGAIKQLTKPAKEYIDVFVDGNFTSVVSQICGGDADSSGYINLISGNKTNGFVTSAIADWIAWTPSDKAIELYYAYDEDMECTCYGYINITSSSLYQAKEIEVTCSSYSGTLYFLVDKNEAADGAKNAATSSSGGVFTYTNPRYGSSAYDNVIIRTSKYCDITSIRFVKAS